MLWFTETYWFGAHLFQHGVAFIYLMAFLVVVRQFKPLAGEEGLTPFTRVIEQSSFRETPSLFHWFPSDRAVTVTGWLGTGIALLITLGIPQRLHWTATLGSWFVLWFLYLSVVNVGRIWYGYGWESMILEAGLLAGLVGSYAITPSILVILLILGLLFRNMLGAGLIKIRGDSCWRELTCMDYHYETQPIPNPLSWFMHHMPDWWHRLEVLFNHLVELIVPFLYFAPQPVAAVAGVLTIIFQGSLLLSGNYAWLNLLTIVMAFVAIPDSMVSGLIGIEPLGTLAPPLPLTTIIIGFTVLTIVLSYYPVKNMLRPHQRMNAGFNALHLVNTYGAFGSVTTDRYELVIEGRNDDGDWQPYRFRGKPTDPDRMPRQIVPYHCRLDWQLWFAAMTRKPRRRWIRAFMQAILDGDDMIRTLMVEDPFDGDPPDEIRIRRFRYKYTDLDGLKEGNWWDREPVNTYYPATTQEQLEHGLF